MKLGKLKRNFAGHLSLLIGLLGTLLLYYANNTTNCLYAHPIHQLMQSSGIRWAVGRGN